MQKRSGHAAGADEGCVKETRKKSGAPTKKTEKKESISPPLAEGAARTAAVARMLGNIGLCVRAGAVVRGTELVCDALKAGSAKLVISAGDNSPNTAKRLHDRCAYYGVRLMVLPATGAELAAAVGRGGVTAAVAVTDTSMVRMIEKAALPLGI